MGELVEDLVPTLGLLLDIRQAMFPTMQGWTATLPLTVDTLTMRRVMDTDAVAAAFPES